MNFKFQISNFKWVVAAWVVIASSSLLPGQERPGQGGGSGGTGGIVSNQVIVATVANIYTNNTPHQIEGVGHIGTTTAGQLQVNVTNSSNVRFAQFKANVATAGLTTNQIKFTVPPGGWYKFGSVTTTLSDGDQELTFYATNGSVRFAATAGSASTASTAASASALAAGAAIAAADGAALTNVAGANVTGSLTNNTTGNAATATTTTNIIGRVKIRRPSGNLVGDYATPQLAVLDYQEGDTIECPNEVYVNQTNLFRKNLHWQFNGTTISNWTDDNGGQLFSDAGIVGTTNQIGGSLKFYYSQGAIGLGFSNSVQFISFTNPLTKVYFKFDQGEGESYPTDGASPFIIFIDGADITLDFNYINCPRLTNQPGGVSELMGGIWRRSGNLRIVGSPKFGDSAQYILWEGETDVATSGDTYANFDESTGYIYASVTNLNIKGWYNYKQLKRTTNGITQDGFNFIGGSWYLNGMKRSLPWGSNGKGLYLTTSGSSEGKVWENLQKSERNGTNDTGIYNGPNFQYFGSVLHFLDTSTNQLPVIQNFGLLSLSDSHYTGIATFLVHKEGATNSSLRGVYVDVSRGTNPAVIIETTNIVATGSYFKASVSTNALVFTGPGTNCNFYPNLPYAFLAQTNFQISFVCGALPSPSVLTNWSLKDLDGFEADVDTGVITCRVPGKYEIIAEQELMPAGNSDLDVFSLNIARNGVLVNPQAGNAGGTLLTPFIPLDETFSTYAQQQQKITAREILFLRAGDQITVRLGSGSGVTASLHAGRITIKHL